MSTRDEIIEALDRLGPVEFEEVINTALRIRYPYTANVGADVPDPQASRDEFARWLAQRHMSSDAAIERVVYLPTGAPEREIRLLEVNRFMQPPDSDAIEPLDFTPDTDQPYKVFVADVTADQWERIRRDPNRMLPSGWNLVDDRIITRG